MDYDLTNEEDIKQYLQNIETEYTYQCFSEKEPDGKDLCHIIPRSYAPSICYIH